MSNRETILDFKSKLNRMGVSLDRTDHPLNYYKEMYFEKSNAKNKVTRDNTSFYNEGILREKRQRERSKDKSEEKVKDKYDSEYEEEEYEEEEEKEDKSDNDYIYEEEEQEKSIEKSKNKKKRRNYSTNITRVKKTEENNENSDYRESGIKITK